MDHIKIGGRPDSAKGLNLMESIFLRKNEKKPQNKNVTILRADYFVLNRRELAK